MRVSPPIVRLGRGMARPHADAPVAAGSTLWPGVLSARPVRELQACGLGTDTAKLKQWGPRAVSRTGYALQSASATHCVPLSSGSGCGFASSRRRMRARATGSPGRLIPCRTSSTAAANRPVAESSLIFCPSTLRFTVGRAAGCVTSNTTRGPIRSARELSLTEAVASDTRRPPTLVGTARDRRPYGSCGSAHV
jgi:hypothetical protein